MASSWDGVTIPNPTSYSLTREFVGSQFIVADGTMRTDGLPGGWWRISLVFDGITVDERDTIVAKATAITATNLIIADELIDSVIPVVNSVSWSRIPGGTRAYTVSCEVRATVTPGVPWTVGLSMAQSRDYISS